MPKCLKPILQRFLEKVDQRGPDECWSFRGYHEEAGYGRFCVNKVNIGAHIASYQMLVGPVPKHLHVHHKCENKGCVNPNHLVAVTPKQHFADLSLNHKAYLNKRKTHCWRGHAFTKDNILSGNLKGWRQCRECARERNRLAQQRRRDRLRVVPDTNATLDAYIKQAENTKNSKAIRAYYLRKVQKILGKNIKVSSDTHPPTEPQRGLPTPLAAP